MTTPPLGARSCSRPCLHVHVAGGVKKRTRARSFPSAWPVRALIAGPLIALLLAACGATLDLAPDLPDASLADGSYYLALADGSVLPHSLPPEQGCEREVTGGRLELDPQGHYRLEMQVAGDCGSSSYAQSATTEGSFLVERERIRFTDAEDGHLFEGALVADTAVEIHGMLYVREGHGTGPSSVEEQLARKVEALIEGYSQPLFANAYRCDSDPLLDQAAAIPAADTAGIGARIATHFSGWRLSTEREIGCRFPLIDGSRPEMFWVERWGSGSAWWIWRGDFDGDGREDRLVMLSRESDPSDDLLVVFFADGRAAEVASPGGWGVVVGPRKGELLDSLDAAPRRLEADAVTVVYWEKGADSYVWDGTRFVGISTGD
jgi:hypothetical protein